MITYPLEVAAVVTRVLDVGPRDGRPVVFVHGLGARADRWRSNLDALGEGVRALALDLPGHGFAGKPADFEYTTPSYASWLLAALDALEIERPVLVGTSLGGHVAATLTVRVPHRVAGLALIAPVGLIPWAAERREATATRASDTSREGVTTKLHALLHDATAVTPELVEEEWRVNNSPGGPEAMRRLADYVRNGIEQHRVLDDLAALVSPPPMLLAWGEHDVSVPIETADAIAARLPAATVLRVPNAGHAPHAEQPGPVNEALRALIEVPA